MAHLVRRSLNDNMRLDIPPEIGKVIVKQVGRLARINAHTNRLLLILGEEKAPGKKVIAQGATIRIIDENPRVIVNGGIDDYVKIILENKQGKPSGMIIIEPRVIIGSPVTLSARTIDRRT